MKLRYVATLSISLGVFYWDQNLRIEQSRITVRNKKIPDAFDGFVIAQISDLHNKSFGKNQCKLLEKLFRLNPDCIVVTGDCIDKRKPCLKKALDFISGASGIAPVYMVSGNHEHWMGRYQLFYEAYQTAGAIWLENRQVELNRAGEKMVLSGLQDPISESKEVFLQNLQQLCSGAGNAFHVLLCHRPEYFEEYVKNKVDCVFAGHAHGGQVRIPWLGPLFAPNQGIFPYYTKGIYMEKETSLIVSRGLGDSKIPLRLGNRPEIVVVTLKK